MLRSDRPTKQNHYYVESEHDPEPGPAGQGRRVSAAVQAGHTLPFLFGLTERNKIKILLRLNRVYVIITRPSHYALISRRFYETLFRLSSDFT